MKHIPILFSIPMVQAEQAGRKDQTRRTRNLNEINENPDHWQIYGSNSGDTGLGTYQQEAEIIPSEIWGRTSYNSTGQYVYRADGAELPTGSYAFGKWKPSIFMPKSACRTFLKVTDVRVERLKDISEADAISEGVEHLANGIYTDYVFGGGALMGFTKALKSFESLWESINGLESWNANPWVWKISFERTEKPENFI